MSKKSRARAAAASQQAASSVSPSPEQNTFLARWGTFFAGVVIILSSLVAYHNSFSGPFILDDSWAITDNPSIRHFGSALLPQSSASTGGRPLLNLTFALNYALGGMDVWGYHVVNLIIHALAGLTLFGIVRRTLLRPPLATRFGLVAFPLALAVAVIWIVHPLQTEAVTYLSQRAESLMGLFYLLTLYCFIRGVESTTPARWEILSITACLLGIMSKEIIVTAPVTVFLYDRTFIAGSFREAWRQRWRYYLGLASIWLLLFGRLRLGLHHQGVGFDQSVTWWSYALTSCRSVVLYLKLALWPYPLVFDYGTDFVRNATCVLPYVLVLIALIMGLVMALWRWPTIGFAGTWFFLILAPTSSVIPLAFQPIAESRMYLSLAAVIGLIVLGLNRWIGRRSLILFAAMALGLGWLTIQRNKDYRSELAIWNDTVTKCPDDARAHYTLGCVLMSLRRSQEAIAQYEVALRIDPNYAEAHNNLGGVLAMIPGRLPDAIPEYEAAVRIKPNLAEAHFNLGDALATIPVRLPDAISEYEAALRIRPDYVEAHSNVGSVLLRIPGRLPDAISHYEAVLRIRPDLAEAHFNLGNALAMIPSRLPDAVSEYEAALRIKPNLAEAHSNLGSVLLKIPGRLPDAISQYEAVLRIMPNRAEAHFNLGNAFAMIPGRLPDAISEYEAALRIKPDYPSAQKNLETAHYMLVNSRGENSSERLNP
jgi:tetratricopeptide (TPR) repeat protein